MKHLKAINQKAARIEAYVAHEAAEAQRDDMDVVGLRTPPHEQDGQPHFPLGCSLVFAPGWEVDSQGGTAGLCQPVERDLFDCHLLRSFLQRASSRRRSTQLSSSMPTSAPLTRLSKSQTRLE